MVPIIRSPDHAWKLDNSMSKEEYANLLTKNPKLEISDAGNFSIVIRSISGTGSHYDIVEITQDAELFGNGTLQALFKHKNSPRTTIAEDILQQYKTGDLHPGNV